MRHTDLTCHLALPRTHPPQASATYVREQAGKDELDVLSQWHDQLRGLMDQADKVCAAAVLRVLACLVYV